MNLSRESGIPQITMPVPTHGSGCSARTYPTKCRVCRAEVFHFACSCGTSILFNTLEPFELHNSHDNELIVTPAKARKLICIRVSSLESTKLKLAIAYAVKRWRGGGVLAREPDRLSSLKYEIWLLDTQDARTLDPLSDLFLAGLLVETVSSSSS